MSSTTLSEDIFGGESGDLAGGRIGVQEVATTTVAVSQRMRLAGNCMRFRVEG